jgi:hypothetical protein
MTLKPNFFLTAVLEEEVNVAKHFAGGTSSLVVVCSVQIEYLALVP